MAVNATVENDEPTDYELHRTLADEIVRGVVTLDIEFARINRNSVPGYRTTDLIVPPLATIVLAGYTFMEFGAVYAGLVLLAGMVAYFLVVRPRARVATVDRVRRLALTHLNAWNAGWEKGGYRVALASDPAIAANSPRDDWRDFVRRNLTVQRG